MDPERRPGTARQQLVRELLEARRILDEAATSLDRSDGDGEVPRYEQALERLGETERRYEASLPRLELSRCPLTGKPYRTALDTGGLDGPWWDAERPVRPEDAPHPTLFALAGAVDLGDTVPETQFLVLPGPGVPWVCPRLLRLPGVRAVVSRIEVAGRPAWPVVYFSDSPHPGVRRIATWGTTEAPGVDRYGESVEVPVYPVRTDYDFDLGPWIATGRLLWIAPNDPGLDLHSSADGCPYLDLPGHREPVMLRRGAARSALIDRPAPGVEAP